MTASDLEYGLISSIELVPSIGKDFGVQIPTAKEAVLTFDSSALDALVRIDEAAYAVAGASSADSADLNHVGIRNLPKVCWILARFPRFGPTQRLTLRLHEFPASLGWPEQLDLAVDEMVVDDVRRKRRRLLSVEEVKEWLSERVLLNEPGFSTRVILSGTISSQQSLAAFRLHGRGLAIDVKADADDKLRITRVVEAKRPRRLDERRPVFLVESAVRFVDSTVAGQFRGTAKTLLDELVRTSTSYLGLWKEYNRIERESTIRRARSLGWLYYSGRTPLPNGHWRFTLVPDDHISASIDRLAEADDIQLEVAATLPAELQPEGESDEQPERRRRERAFSGTYISADRQRRTIDVLPPSDYEGTQPPASGVLFPSLTGDRRRLERREVAQARIVSATCAMPQLGLLIEGQAVPERRARHIDPADSRYRALIHEAMGGEPTARQLEALRDALNTPDICLIQGPPGTGKTRVIVALQSILAELDESRTNVAGRILLTSYQHDAVENAALRTSVFGLPAMKIGKRRDQPDQLDGFHRWRQDRIEALRADLAGMQGTAAGAILRQVQSLAAGYRYSALPNENVSGLLRSVAELASEYLPPDLRDRLLQCRQRFDRRPEFFRSVEADERDAALQAVRGIRTEVESFEDDGPHNCQKALIRAQAIGVLEDRDDELLSRAAEWTSGSPIDFLPQLATLRGELIDRLAPRSEMSGIAKVDSEVEQVLSEIVEALFVNVRSSTAGVQEVLWEYLDALENDVYSIRAAVNEYTVVLAATCQQAASRQMSEVKGIGASLSQLSEIDQRMVFKDVVIDEAARANPLDLLVPMALAERRIVLVGDHRQLPHILEPDVEREIERSVQQETRDQLKKSLFERLFTDLRNRESRDGIKRTVTLNLQFRMHPVLGKFVSDTFYAPYGEDFESVKNVGQFDHGLASYQGKVAAWVDIPISEGRETGGRTKRRNAEARWIAAEVRRLALERPDLSFGVITFYSGQRDALMRALVELGLAESGEGGAFEIRDAWRETTGTRKERLRVGTVDAFQGKEFDVVLLSITRSNEIEPRDQKALRQKFGHLMLENRLCVAMSRQQRLLIGVGDAGMFKGDAAEEAVTGLVRFYKLCGGAHGIRL